MASSKKKTSSKKPVAKAQAKAAPKAKAKKPAPKAKPAPKKPAPKKPAPKAKPAPKKPAPKTNAPAPKTNAPAPKTNAPAKAKAAPKSKTPKVPTHGDAWGNASLESDADEAAPMPKMAEPSGTPKLALHDHEGELVSPVEESEEIAERIHGGEEAVKDADEDDDTGSPRLDDRQDGEDGDDGAE